MKIVTLMVLWMLCGVVYAGPGKELKQVVPVPECHNWTGFYLGGFVGYKYASSNNDLNFGGSWLTYQEPTVQQTIAAYHPRDLDASGLELGGLIGYNYEFQNHWVVGLEADGAYLWLGKTRYTGIYDDPGVGFSEQSSLKTHYLVTVGPRIGYAFCKWFPYVTGGLAIGDLEYNEDAIIYPNGPHSGIPFWTAKNYVSNVGWMVGAGVEYAITDHWIARVQYQYVDLGSVNACSNDLWPGNSSFVETHSATLTEHNVSLAIIYQF